MLLKVIIIIYSVVIRNTIFSQPVNENNIISNSQQRTYEECCPCPKFLEDERDQELSPTDSLPRMPAEDCQCLSSDADSFGSSSVFRPFLLRAAQSGERQRNPKPDVKPLLQPEVGLASSVLETLQKATDEKYEDALAREAARNAAKNGLDIVDIATGNSRNSVTIVLNPREDLYVDETIPEASHIQETRCIHGPLGKEHVVGRTRTFSTIPKEYLLKRKPLILSHKSYDMDNSASNIQESLYANCNNNLDSKLKMNPLLINKFINNIDRKVQDISDPVSDSGYQSQKTSPQYYEDSDINNNDHLTNGPAVILASLKNKLRDLSEKGNLKLLKNNLNIPRSKHVHHFNFKPGNSNVESNNLEANIKSPMDTFFDKQSPIVKTILKLKDVELIPPKKTNNNGLMRENNVDLKFAGTENDDCVLVTEDRNINEVAGKNDIITNDSYSNKLTNMQEAKKVDFGEDQIEDTCEIQSDEQIITESKDSYHNVNKDTKQFQTDDGMLSQKIDSIIEGEKTKTFLKDDFKIESNEDVDNIQDSMPEMSNNILQKSSIGEDNTLNENFENNINDEVNLRQNVWKTEHNQINSQTNLLENNGINSNLLQRKSEDLSSFKEDMLRRLENLKKTIKSKLQEPESNKSAQMVSSQYLLENKSDNTTNPESLLEKENPLESESGYPQEAECKTSNNFRSSNEDYDIPSNEFSDIKSLPKELDCSETQVVGIPSTKNNEEAEGDDDKLKTQQENKYLQNLKNVCDLISDDSFYAETKKVISKDFLPLNEMSSQASTFTPNAIPPANNNNNLKSSLQDIIVQPIHLTDIVSPDSNTLQIPSLEDIRQGITDIIDAGEQEVGNLRSAISDSLNESSNYSPFASANTNLLSENFKTRPLKNTLANSLANRYNVYPYKSKPFVAKTAPLKDITLKPLLNNKVGTQKNGLPLGSSKIKPLVKPSLKSPSHGFSLKDVPSLASLKEFLQNRSNVYPGIEIPSTNIDKISIFSPQIITSIADDIKYNNNALKSNLQRAKEDKHFLSKSNTEPNGLLEAIDKRRENFNEKIEALHLDFNDRLASIHEKLLDQSNLQSVNIPQTDWYSKNSPLLGISRDTQFQNELPRKQYNIERNLPLASNSLNMQERTNHNEIAPLKLSLPSLSTIERKHHLRKQDSLTPLRSSNVKIMFSTTTRRPIVTPKLIKKPVPSPPARKPLKLKDEHNDVNKGFNLKGPKPYYSKYKPLWDTSKSPSQTIQTKIPFLNNFSNENEEETNYQVKLGEHRSWGIESLGQKQPVPYNSPLSSKNSDLPNTTESSIISNMRNALRAKLENAKAPKSMKAQETMISDSTNSDTRVLLPENVKINSVDSFLKENTSYKCNMICVKEP